MVDYFELLGAERRPFLDPARVIETFRELSRSQHPDKRAGDSEEYFALLNQAQQTLSDPKTRLGYLMGLEFPQVRLAGPTEVPGELASLFTPVHDLLTRVDALLARKAAAPAALARALLAREELALRDEVEAQFQTLTQLHAEALGELRDFDATWQSGDASMEQPLRAFYQRFSYLTRWLDQLRERLFQLGQ